MSIQVKQISKSFGDFKALHDITLDFPTGELIALVGPSGCGKTSLLRIIAGLESASHGQVILEGEDATDLHVRKRQVGFVFQHYALFRHMTVFENVAFGLRVRPKTNRPSDADIKRRVNELLDLVQLKFLADRFPAQLSGGQRQRIALARALAVEPRVLLLDEPFGALDAKVRKELRQWLRKLHDELHISSIFVTHDQEEALEVADQIVVMNKGRIEQVGSPREVYDNPATPFVFDFLGNANRFEGSVSGDYIVLPHDKLLLPANSLAKTGNIVVYARPQELDIYISKPTDVESIQATFVRDVWLAGVFSSELVDRQGQNINVALSPERQRELNLSAGQTVWVVARQLHVFEQKSFEHAS